MEFLDMLSYETWDNTFYDTDCNETRLVLFGFNHIKTVILSIYTVFVLCTGYIYGRHKGLQPTRVDGFLNYQKMKTKFLHFLSQFWFIASIFIFPWYLCLVWLYYSIHLNDFHYITDYNPWILPFIIIYILYSITVITSFKYYSGAYNRCAYIAVRANIMLCVGLAMFIGYVLLKNKNNDVKRFSFIAFHGNVIYHCFNLDKHRNPIILSIIMILYMFITHHMFVTLRAIAAKLCNTEYISKTDKFENKKKRVNKYNLDAEGNRHNLNIDNDCMSDDMAGCDEYDTDDYNNFSDVYIRNRSASRHGHKRKSKYDNEPDAGTPEPIEPNQDEIWDDNPPRAYEYV